MSLIGNPDTPSSYVADYMQACVGMFGIPAGGFTDTLEAYGDATDWNVESLYAAMLNSSIGRSIYAPGVSNETFATKLVAKLGGSLLADADEAAAIDVVKAALDGGMSLAAAAMASVEFVAALETSDTTYGAVAQQFQNRIEIANYYTFSSTSPSSTLSTLTAILSPVTNTTDVTDPAAVLEENTDPGVSTGQTYTLTTGVDSLIGTSGNDTFKAVMDTIANGGTFNSGDSVSGGAGVDSIEITVTDNSQAPAVTLDAVEKVVAYVTGANNPAGLSGATWAGVTHVGAKNTITDHATQDAFTVNNLQNNVTLTMQNISVGTDDDLVLDVTFGSGKVGSTTATLAVDTNAVGSSTKDAEFKVTTAGSDVFTAMTVAATGANYITLTEGGAASTNLDSLTVTGTGSVKLTDSGTELDGIKTITATDNSGGVTVNISANITEDITVTGGSGNDDFTVALDQKLVVAAGAGDDVVTLGGTISTTTLATGDSISGGDGSADVIAMDDASWDALDGDATADRALISGFEIARVTDALATTIDVSKFSINHVQLTTATASDSALISGLTSGATVEYRAQGDSTEEVELTMTGATNASTPDDTLNLKLNSDIAAADTDYDVAFAVDGINIINITTADRINTDGATDRTEGYNLTFQSTKDSNVSTMNVSGSSKLSYTANSSATALATINATNLSGDLIINLGSFGGTQGVTITGGSGANSVYATGYGDSITGGSRADYLQGAGGNDTLSGGAGNDTLDGGAGSDSMTGGDGADTFYVAATTLGTGSSTDKITDLVAGTDKINYGGTAAPTAFTEVTTDLSAKTTLADAATTAGGTIGAGNAGTFVWDSKTWLLIDANATTGFTDGTDIVVDVTGLSGSLKTTDFSSTGLTLTGTPSNDILIGTASADTIEGLAGDDTITLGGGNDTVKFSGSTAASNGADTISTFNTGDKYNFSSVLSSGSFLNTVNTGTGAITEYTATALAASGTSIAAAANKLLVIEVANKATIDSVADIVTALANTGVMDAVDVAASAEVILVVGGADDDTTHYIYGINNNTAAAVTAGEVALLGTVTTDITNGIAGLLTTNFVF